MPGYIEREALLEKAIKEKRFVFQMEDLINNEVVFKTVYKDLAEFIKSAPSADVAPVRHGRWVQKIDHYICSVCGDDCWAFSAPEYNYCPNCGCRMDLSEGEPHDT